MKKIKILLFVLAIFMIAPVVKAAELPQSGVTYFLQYPNRREDATTSYQEAKNPKEQLIYTASTDKNGQVLLCDWNKEGTIRVVQHVPDGYTTNEREISLDLSNTNNISFIDYRGLSNPNTGRTLLFIVVIMSVIAITLVARKNKKVLFIIPIVAITVFVNKANATNDCFTIQINDGSGNPLRSVQVDVYAKPTNVEANPAVKFVAAGGRFFDGTTIAYMRLPYNSITADEFWNTMPVEDADYFDDNMMHATREGYYLDGYIFPDVLVNGTEIPADWMEDNSARVFEIRGNGGTYDFYGKQLTSVYSYEESDILKYAPRFIKGDSYYIGFDDNAACSAYNNYGIHDTYVELPDIMTFAGTTILSSTLGDEMSETVSSSPSIQTYVYYDCWNNRPDGIYINDTVFLGKPETCFFESFLHKDSGDYYFINNTYNKSIYAGYYQDLPFSFSAIYNSYTDKDGNNSPKKRMIMPEGIESEIPDNSREAVNKIEVVRNGVTILTINSSEITNYQDAEASFVITNDEKRQILESYLEEMNQYECITRASAIQGL